MSLTKTVAENLKSACVQWDISTRDLAQRISGNQKSVWNVLNGRHSPRLDTLEPMLQVLMISPQAAVTPSVGAELLMGRRIPRLIDSYKRLSAANRDVLEAIIEDMLKKD